MRTEALILALALALAPGLSQAQGVPSTRGALPPQVDSAPLGETDPGAVGLLSPRMTGLPAALWQRSDGVALEGLIGAIVPVVPALQDLMHTLMLAEALPPEGHGMAHLGARLDWLIDNGAVDEAAALLEIVGHDRPALFARWADLALLQGQPESACRTQAAEPRLSGDWSLRVFCIARSGDWTRAALVLQGARTLGTIPERRVDLLERFLDPELAEGAPPLLPPVRPTPLEFRLFEALGEPLPTAPLPLAFSVLDLTGDNGWRAQIEAAERLARAGSLPANRLLGLYTLREPAASGGVWDRVAAFQAFEAALARGRPDAVGPALQRVWPQMASARLLVPFAELFATGLAAQRLEGRAARMAQRAAFLSADYEGLAPAAGAPTDAETAFLASLARGKAPASIPDLPHAEAVAAGFAGAPMPPVLAEQLAAGRLGEVILRAVALFSSGAEGNGADLADALATFRALGLEDVARRAALQLVLLDAERAL
ncbi:hypothetical protein [Thetidibacter halocola]|uniref:Antifreeze glycopeptide polyprotein n=1 Tax=Thetidibacter halocola TaxID=2827239 RepID=A0A8J7WCM3_9RHOB|nr:hypothetical protein [Thetidibacter halocola]MBS0122936.1 hypothetical protein [Thetidibacter halocola]